MVGSIKLTRGRDDSWEMIDLFTLTHKDTHTITHIYIYYYIFIYTHKIIHLHHRSNMSMILCQFDTSTTKKRQKADSYLNCKGIISYSYISTPTRDLEVLGPRGQHGDLAAPSPFGHSTFFHLFPHQNHHISRWNPLSPTSCHDLSIETPLVKWQKTSHLLLIIGNECGGAFGAMAKVCIHKLHQIPVPPADSPSWSPISYHFLRTAKIIPKTGIKASKLMEELKQSRPDNCETPNQLQATSVATSHFLGLPFYPLGSCEILW